MEDTLEALLPNAAFERIAGTNRYKTNAAFSAATFPVEGWESVNSVGFTSTNPETDDLFMGLSGSFNTTTGFMYAPIQLPDGAKIVELEATVVDNHASNISVSLMQVNTGGGNLTMGVVQSDLSPGEVTLSDTTINVDVVDNHAFNYVIYVTNSLNGALFLRSVRVRYQLGAPTG
jgi:hypothetical protein